MCMHDSLHTGENHKKQMCSELADVIASVDMLKRQQPQLAEQIQAQQTQLDSLLLQSATCEDRHSALCQDIDLMVAENEDSQQAASTIKLKSEQLRQECTCLQEEIVQLQGAVLSLSEEKSHIETSMLEMKSHAPELEMQQNVLQQNCQEKESTLASAMSQLDAVMADFMLLTVEAKLLNAGLSECQLQVDAKTEQNALLGQDQRVLGEQLVELKLQQQGLQHAALKDKTQRQLEHSELTHLLEQKAKLNAEVQELQAESVILFKGIEVNHDICSIASCPNCSSAQIGLQQKEQTSKQLAEDQARVAELTIQETIYA